MSTEIMSMPAMRMRRFLLLHHNDYVAIASRLFGHAQGEGVVFGNGTTIVEINGSTYQYGSLDELLRVFVSSGLLILKWIDEEQAE